MQEDGLGNYTLKIRPGVYKIQVEGPIISLPLGSRMILGILPGSPVTGKKAEVITANESEIQ